MMYLRLLGVSVFPAPFVPPRMAQHWWEGLLEYIMDQNEIDRLRELVDDWRLSAEDFDVNRKLMESAPHEHLRRGAKLQQGWCEALRNCADKLEKVLGKPKGKKGKTLCEVFAEEEES